MLRRTPNAHCVPVFLFASSDPEGRANIDRQRGAKDGPITQDKGTGNANNSEETVHLLRIREMLLCQRMFLCRILQDTR